MTVQTQLKVCKCVRQASLPFTTERSYVVEQLATWRMMFRKFALAFWRFVCRAHIFVNTIYQCKKRNAQHCQNWFLRCKHVGHMTSNRQCRFTHRLKAYRLHGDTGSEVAKQSSRDFSAKCQKLSICAIKRITKLLTELHVTLFTQLILSLIHIWRCRRSTLCRSRWSPYH